MQVGLENDLFQITSEFLLGRSVIRKYLCQIRAAHVFVGGLGKNVAEIGRHVEVAAFVKFVVFQALKIAVNLAAFDRIAEDEHRVRVAVVGAACAVLAGRAAKFRHRHQNDVVHTLAEIGAKCGDRVPQNREADWQAGRGRCLR